MDIDALFVQRLKKIKEEEGYTVSNLLAAIRHAAPLAEDHLFNEKQQDRFKETMYKWLNGVNHPDPTNRIILSQYFIYYYFRPEFDELKERLSKEDPQWINEWKELYSRRHNPDSLSKPEKKPKLKVDVKSDENKPSESPYSHFRYYLFFVLAGVLITISIYFFLNWTRPEIALSGSINGIVDILEDTEQIQSLKKQFSFVEIGSFEKLTDFLKTNSDIAIYITSDRLSINDFIVL